MKQRVFNYETEPNDKPTIAAMANAWAIIMDLLPKHLETQLTEEFKVYRDERINDNKSYTPAYLWTLNRIKNELDTMFDK